MSERYTYEPRPSAGRALPKHKWTKNEPGFLDRPGGEVEGMCPARMGRDTLEALLNEGVEHYVRAKGSTPAAIFNIHDGVPYKAFPTRRGHSFHGFPCRRKDVPPEVYRDLLARAREKNCEPAVQKWFSKYP